MRTLRRDGPVTSRDQLATDGGGDAVNLGDNGLGQGADGQHYGSAAIEQIAEIRAPFVGRGAACRHLLQIVARAEYLARPGQHDRADLPVLREHRQVICQGGQHRIAERIQPLGGVQGQPDYCAGIAALNQRDLVTPLMLRSCVAAAN